MIEPISTELFKAKIRKPKTMPKDVYFNSHKKKRKQQREIEAMIMAREEMEYNIKRKVGEE